MTAHRTAGPVVPPEVAAEVALEQAHVDKVYSELAKAGRRVELVEAEGLARGRTDRTGVARDEEITGLFERDALMFSAGKRRASLEQQYEGLVFGRLDLDHDKRGREVRYIGRIGVRDDDYEPLVIDWRAPAASAFYQATPVEPMDVLRRRVLRCRDAVVLGVEDDLMVAEAPDDMVVVGDGALMAALTRTRGAQMRDIVATIQRHQDEAIRASSRGVTEITGGPGTGKTVVALHRAAYLLYSDRRRYESGGILVVGPSSAYTAYIERVLPSLGEDTVTLRSLGDVVDGTTGARLDEPEAARVKGSLTIRRVLSRAARDLPPEAPQQLRTMVAGHPVRLDRQLLQQIRRRVLRHHQHNLAHDAVVEALGEAAWVQVRPHVASMEKPEFLDRFEDHLEVEAFVQDWWRPIDPREVLLWLAEPARVRRYTQDLLSDADADALQQSMAEALRTGEWSAADIALVDDVSARLGLVQDKPREERGFYQIEELDNLSDYGVTEVEVAGSRSQAADVTYERNPADARERLLLARISKAEEYAHVLVDEAQDLSPMQWRMVGRRGRYASWTVVGDAAQSSWPVEAEALEARNEAFGSKQRQRFHMSTNYRNAREIFDYAAEVIRREVPDADIPDAVRETGVHPVVTSVAPDSIADAAQEATKLLLDEVQGAVAVVAPARWRDRLGHVADLAPGRVMVIDPMSTKGLEYDATVVVDPTEITRESPGGIRVLYVALTRAAHRMTVLEVPS
ncbi:HelD family protein [Luteipulveratus halotolerans]|uniref:Helicase n=1 Tax=Luteipulveratus halotolerans TaxID=1631356 RepID=A0A0L6CP52_9MICO|nr:UvrD-helicase domain-containing protein [Luteipulveratus halotolerans]KNX39534.1 helicase [Luteipulveratus halotolerans]